MTGNFDETFSLAHLTAVIPNEERVRNLLGRRGWIASSLDLAEAHPDHHPNGA
jgi:hypothetical protein